METNQKTALVVAQPGKLRDSLQVLLTAISQLETVMVADDGSTALRMMVNRRPTVVLIDFDCQPEGAISLLESIKADWPQVHCLFLTDKPLSSKVLVSGVDGVLRKGMSAVHLFETVARFIVSSCGNQP